MPGTTEDRIKKGIEVIRAAIGEGNAKEIIRCLTVFKKLKASSDDITEAIGDCPLSLLRRAGYIIVLHSKALGKDITLGRDVSWKNVEYLFKLQPTPAELGLLIDVLTVFNGRIYEIGGKVNVNKN